MTRIDLKGVALRFKINRIRLQPKAYRIRCGLCGVTGLESAPKIGGNYNVRTSTRR